MTMGKKKSRPRPGSIEYFARDGFWREALHQGRCQNCGSTAHQWQAHHVVYQQHVEDVGEAPWDNANSMRLCEDCHRKHHNRSAVIPLVKLRAATIAYAFDILGLRAYSYLSEKYAGEDPRLEQALATAEGEHGGSVTPAL